MRFCKFCGAPLPGAGESQPAPPPPERRAAVTARPGYAQAAQPVADGPPAPYGAPHPPAASAVTSDPDRYPRRPDSLRSPVDSGQQRLDGAQQQPPVGAKTGLYVPFASASSPHSGRLVVVGSDGQEGPSFPLTGDQVDIGRSEGTVVLPDDRYMSPRHARLVRIGGRWHVRDLQSTNGVLYRISKPHELADGDLLLVGVEVLRFELVMEAELALGTAIQHGTFVFGSPALPRAARLVQRTVEGVARDVYHLHRIETVIGRESGDIVFTDDPYMSRRHAMVRRTKDAGKVTLVDLNSSNGTFVAIRGDMALEDGDAIRVGQHLFRVELAPR
ncbi:MAG: FHA domain-containing protein [Polyangiaceae bacterium]|jgi:pSer/pThr/pTyr-binding forkhead associated (FHA) protein|nr:FHA domain-containing protein [Polyangiaceae bacterium]